ncbi:hypothetical protein AAC387_Pa01g3918 [Persea americana]
MPRSVRTKIRRKMLMVCEAGGEEEEQGEEWCCEMNDFKSTPDFSTASSNNSGESKELHSSPTKPSSPQGGLQESKSRDVPELPKPSKRNQDSSNPSSKQGRRHKKSSSGAESPTKDSCGAQKESRRKKMRDSSHGGSTRSSSRSKAQDASCSDQDMKSEDQFPELF